MDSEGRQVENPKYFRSAQAELRRKQRRLARRKRGSNRRRKARVQVALLHEKISNQRRDFAHKTANYYVENYGVIYVEDLKIANMQRAGGAAKRGLNKAIGDVSWGMFLEMLTYKAAEAGRDLVKVKPHYTSQKCSRCGEIVKKSLSVRTHKCSCGFEANRDYNAAVNILALGLESLALAN